MKEFSHTTPYDTRRKKPKSILGKLLSLGAPPSIIKNGDIVTYSHLNKHHSGEPTAYGGITGVVELLDDECSFSIKSENCTLIIPSRHIHPWGVIIKDKSVLLEKDGVTFRHFFKH